MDQSQAVVHSFKYIVDKDMQQVGRFTNDLMEYGARHTDANSFTITTPSRHQVTFIGNESIYPDRRYIEKTFVPVDFTRINPDTDEPDYEDNFVYIFGSTLFDTHNLQLVIFKHTSSNIQDGFVMFIGNVYKLIENKITGRGVMIKWSADQQTQYEMFSDHIVDGFIDGHGVRIQPDMHIEGDFVDGLLNCQRAIAYTANGEEYIGPYTKGYRSGAGQIIYHKKGNVYKGQFKNGYKNGPGEYFYKQLNRTFKGVWKKGKKVKETEHDIFKQPTLSDKVPQLHYNDTDDIYRGAFKHGTPNGYGMMIYSDGTVYKGEWLNDKKHGHGQLMGTDESVYKGEFKDDQVCGTGEITFSNGRYFKGQFVDNHFNGTGFLRFENGDEYTGEFKDGEINGKGTAKYPNGDQYTGEWADGKFNGTGTYKFADGGVYEGNFVDGNRDGDGVMRYSNKDVYEGQFKEGNKEGKGVYKFADGGVYTGSYKKDLRHGYGTLTYSNGNIYRGQWENDKCWDFQCEYYVESLKLLFKGECFGQLSGGGYLGKYHATWVDGELVRDNAD